MKYPQNRATSEPAGARDVARRLERCEAFGAWTREDARAWWCENAPVVTPLAEAVDESNLTLVRPRTEPVTESGPERRAALASR